VYGLSMTIVLLKISFSCILRSQFTSFWQSVKGRFPTVTGVVRRATKWDYISLEGPRKCPWSPVLKGEQDFASWIWEKGHPRQREGKKPTFVSVESSRVKTFLEHETKRLNVWGCILLIN
jgi:hypothetical protein